MPKLDESAKTNLTKDVARSAPQVQEKSVKKSTNPSSLPSFPWMRRMTGAPDGISFGIVGGVASVQPRPKKR